MKNNDFAITNIETMAHNVSTYASYFDRRGDIFGEVDNAVQDAEKALLELARIMKLTNEKDESDMKEIMNTTNGHNPELVAAINKAWNTNGMMGNFGFILGAIAERDSEEMEEHNIPMPETFDETMGVAGEILLNICDDEDLRTILAFVGYTQKKKGGA